MATRSNRDALERLERLILESAGNARSARLLAERVLHELNFATQARVAPVSRRRVEEESAESDAESGWRLAA